MDKGWPVIIHTVPAMPTKHHNLVSETECYLVVVVLMSNLCCKFRVELRKIIVLEAQRTPLNGFRVYLTHRLVMLLVRCQCYA